MMSLYKKMPVLITYESGHFIYEFVRQAYDVKLIMVRR